MSKQNECDIGIDKDKLIENLKCPITLDIFKDPVFIPECGHTFDKNALKSLPQKKCPLCNQAFIGNSDEFKTNWSIASILEIEIKNNEINPIPEILSYNAIKAKKDRENYISETTNKIMIFILGNIKKLAMEAKTSYDFDTSKIPNPITKALIDELRIKGFTVHIHVSQIGISWE